VSAEILSYFVFFIILRKIRKSLLINILIIVICVLLRVFKLSSPITDCLTFFFLGGSSALLFQSFNSFSYKKIIDAVIFALALFFLILVIFLNFQENNHFLYVFQFIYIPIVLYLSAINFSLLEKSRNIILLLGNLTYSSYLIHFPIQLLISIICLIVGIKINFYNNVFFLIYIFLVLILSHFTYINFERPIKENIRKIFYKFISL
jgi:peptidoglycan/LPS O-acetylase OafA/YrhL